MMARTQDKYFYILYGALFSIICIMGLKEYIPPMPVRLAFIMLSTLPSIYDKKWVVGSFSCILIFTFNGCAYSPFPYNYYLYLIFLVILTFLHIHGLKANNHQLVVPFILFLIFTILIDLLFGGAIKKEILQSILFIILFSFVVQNKEEESLKILSYGCAISTIITSLDFIFLRQLYDTAILGNTGLERSGWMDPNYFGTIIGTGTAISIIHLFRDKNTIFAKVLYLCAIGVSFMSIPLTASRGAILAVAGVLIFLFMFTKVKVYLKVLATTILVLLIYLLFNGGYFDVLSYRLQNEDIANGSGRVSIWIDKIQALWHGNPIHWFIGYGNHGAQFIGSSARGMTCHNDFVACLTEYGLIGLSIFLYILFLPYKIIKQHTSTIKSRIFVMAALLYLLLVMFTLNPMTGGQFAYYAFWFYIYLLATSLMSQINTQPYE